MDDLKSRTLPELPPAPRPVPLHVQWQLFKARPSAAIGLVFVGGGVAFLITFLSEPGGLTTPWTVIPVTLLGVGLVLTVLPLVAWRRRVAVLKHGCLAPARIVAAQDRGGVGLDGEPVVNTLGPWEDYEHAFAKAHTFWTKTRVDAAPVAVPVLGCMGCAASAMGLFGLAFGVLFLALIWLAPNAAENPPEAKVMWTLGIIGFTAVYVAGAALMRHVFRNMGGIAAGGMTPAKMGVRPVARCRFVYSLPDGGEAEVTADVDLRSRLQTGRAEPEDIAIYLPDQPRRALLLGGLWPPVAVGEEGWFQPRR